MQSFVRSFELQFEYKFSKYRLEDELSFSWHKVPLPLLTNNIRKIDDGKKLVRTKCVALNIHRCQVLYKRYVYKCIEKKNHRANVTPQSKIWTQYNRNGKCKENASTNTCRLTPLLYLCSPFLLFYFLSFFASKYTISYHIKFQ